MAMKPHQPQQPQQVSCPNCRGGNPPNALACQWCGYTLTTPQPVAASVVALRAVGTLSLIVGAIGVAMYFAGVSAGGNPTVGMSHIVFLFGSVVVCVLFNAMASIADDLAAIRRNTTPR
jgi:hypothetical protein